METLSVLAPIPPQLREKLSESHRLVELAHIEDRAGIRIAVTTSMAGCNAATMDLLPNLGLIACNGVGLDLVDLDAARARGIVVHNTPGVLDEDVADAAIGLMFAVVRGIVAGDRFVRAGRWIAEKPTLSRRMAGRTVGVVGMGRIGRAVAARLRGLGMTVLYTTPTAKPDLPYEHVANVARLAGRSDILILACPGGDATRGLIDLAVLEQLGAEGFLINIARGDVIDEPALIGALQTRIIAGAALDVFMQEPDIDARFMELENVVLQPHYAALTHETRADIATELDRAIAAFLTQSD